MDDTIDLDQLCERYRSERERHPAEPPLDTAARVLAWAGDRLDGYGMRRLAISAESAFARDGIPPGLRFSPRTVTLIERYLLHPEMDGDARLAAGLVEPDRTIFRGAGLIEHERRYSLDADLAAGRRTPRDLTRAEYSETIDVLDCNEAARLIGYLGWMPVAIVAIVAGIVVALISGVWWLFLLTALGGTIVGYVAVIGVWRSTLTGTFDGFGLAICQMPRG